MITARMPDGTILRFPEGTSDDVIDRAAQEYIAEANGGVVQTPSAEPDVSPVPAANPMEDVAEASFVDDALNTAAAFTQGLTLGFSDEIGAAVASVAAWSQDDTGKSYSDIYNEMHEIVKQREEGFATRNPTTALVAEVAGGALSPASLGLTRFAVSAGKGAVATSAGIGATEGALYGFGAADGGLAERSKQAAVGSVTGGVLGGAVGKAGQVYSNRKANKFLDTVQEELNRTSSVGKAGNLTGRLKDMGYSDAKIERVQMEMAKANRNLSVPTNSRTEANELLTKETTLLERVDSKVAEWGGTIRDQLNQIDGALGERLNQFEYGIRRRTTDQLKEVSGFLRGYRALREPDQKRLSQLLMQGDYDEARRLLDDVSPAMTDTVDDVQGVLAKIGSDLQHEGHTFGLIDNYFPRIVKDYAGIRRAMGEKEWSRVEQAFETYVKNNKNVASVDDIPSDVKDEIVNRLIRGYDLTYKGGKPSYAKRRARVEIGQNEVGTNYADAAEALERYIVRSANDVERRRFFDIEGGQLLDNDVPETIRSLLEKRRQQGIISDDQIDKAVDLLNARFVGGERAMGSTAAAFRDLGSMTTIGNVSSAAFQLSDIATPMFLQGVRNTAKGLYTALRGTGAKLEDIGIDDVIMEELRQDAGSFMSRALDKTFKMSGFKMMDKLGKETAINSARARYKGMATNAKGRAKIADKYKNSFSGSEMDEVLDDLAAGRITDKTKYVLFSELTDMQPITKSEMPEAFNNMTDGRLLYQLKSFMIKQGNIFNQNVIREARKGNKEEAAKNAVRFATVYGLMGMGGRELVNVMNGREPMSVENVFENMLWYLGSMAGVSKYSANQVASGDMSGAIVNFLAPAAPFLDVPFHMLKQVTAEDPNYEAAMRNIPLAGNLIYNWFGGGAEKFDERRRREEGETNPYNYNVETDYSYEP